jgi:ubiquinone/menaquinone biosynthesis C-methylase UbiE
MKLLLNRENGQGRTRKLSRIFDIPVLYRIFSWLVATSGSRQELVDHYIRPTKGSSMLDIGCGPADILSWLPRSVHYVGYDINSACVETARSRYGDRGTFLFHGEVNDATVPKEGFDIIIAIGILHHLDDLQAVELFRFADSRMKPDGRLVTLDGCYTSGCSRFEHYILSNDRGDFVRTEEGYRNLAQQVFGSVKVTMITSMLRIPYTYIIMECRK